MNLKDLVKKTGLTQLQIAKRLGITPSALNMQINMHRLLPEKHLDGFCSILKIKKEKLIKAMSSEGVINE